MKVRTIVKAGTISLLTLIGACNTLFQIDEKQQAVVTQFGNPYKIILGSNEAGEIDTSLVSKVSEWNAKQPDDKCANTVTAGPGIYFKLPWPIQSVDKFDDRLLNYNSPETDAVTLDKKHLLVDTYAKWRINNPLLFKQTVITENGAKAHLDINVYSIVREYVGKNNLIELVKSTNSTALNSEGASMENIFVGKEKIMKEMTAKCNEKMAAFGMEIVDVRMRKSDLPADNAASVYARMNSERQRIAKQYRSEGEEEATKIRAIADRDKVSILSESYKISQDIMGEGDAEATAIYNRTYSKNPRFFKLWKTTEAYSTAFKKGDNTKMVIDPGSDYMQYLK